MSLKLGVIITMEKGLIRTKIRKDVKTTSKDSTPPVKEEKLEKVERKNKSIIDLVKSDTKRWFLWERSVTDHLYNKIFRFEVDLEVSLRNQKKEETKVFFDEIKITFESGSGSWRNRHYELTNQMNKEVVFKEEENNFKKEFKVVFNVEKHALFDWCHKDFEFCVTLKSRKLEFKSNKLKISLNKHEIEVYKFKNEFETFSKENVEYLQKLEKEEGIQYTEEEMDKKGWGKMNIFMERGRYPTRVIKTRDGNYKTLFTFPFKINKNECKSKDNPQVVIVFKDHSKKAFWRKAIKLEDFNNKRRLVYRKKIEVENVDLIFREFPVFVQLIDTKNKFYSNSIILKSVEYFGNLSNVKYERFLPSLLQELKENKFKIKKTREEKVVVRKKTLSDLPYEVLNVVFSFFVWRNITKNISCVSKYFYKVSNFAVEGLIGRELMDLDGVSKKLVEFVYRQNDNSWKKSMKFLRKLTFYVGITNSIMLEEHPEKSNYMDHDEMMKKANKLKEMRERNFKGDKEVSFDCQWYTKDEYDDAGATIVGRPCF